MAEIDKPNSQLTAVKWRFPSVHPEGRKFTLIAAFLTLAVYSMVKVVVVPEGETTKDLLSGAGCWCW